jgi:hypothetical protein
VLLGLLVEAFVPEGPVVLGFDESLERRRGRKLTARAIYHDAARSSKSYFAEEQRLTLDVPGAVGPLAAAPSAPARLGLFSFVALIVQRQPAWQQLFWQSAWQKKVRPTFGDAVAHVRRALWRQLGFWLSQAAGDPQKSPHLLCEHVAQLLAYFT